MKKAPYSTLNLEPLVALFLFLITCSCQPENQSVSTDIPNDKPYLMVLGVAQDAGYPQAGERSEFESIASGRRIKQHTVSLLLVDPLGKKRYLFEATPDFREQLEIADKQSVATKYPYDGIFLTHAHMGHYVGLMHLGFEAMGAKETLVYAMPRMKDYLETNGPWSQLVDFNNIVIQPMQDSTVVQLPAGLSVLPFTVPHRDEFSEIVGFQIMSDNLKIVFIPDIDKWEKWDVDIREVIKQNDYTLIDASFFADGELRGRDMSIIPHPFTSESMALFENLPATDKAKVVFIHSNHTNPILDLNSKEYQEVLKAGFNIAIEGMYFEL